MCNILMEGSWDVGSLSVRLGKGHLNMVKMTDGPRDSQVHRSEFSNKSLKLLAGHTPLGGGGI